MTKDQDQRFLTYRDEQRVDRVSSSVRRPLVKFRKRPNPPRGLRFAVGVLQWETPYQPDQVTHYRIYANVESNLVREIPAGQLFLNDNLSAERVFVSSYNANSKLESIKVLLDVAISPDHVDFVGRPGRKVLDGAITSGSKIFHSLTANFSPADVGEYIVVRGAGVNSTDLSARIITRSGGTVVTLDIAASTTVTGATAAFGPDNADLLQAAVDGFYYILVPAGIYLISTKINFNEHTHLSGRSRGVEIWEWDASDYAFEFLSDIQAAAYDLNSGIMFENLTLVGKYGVKINRETIPTPPDYQGHVLHVGFHNVELQGQYNTDGTWGRFLHTTDPDDSTDIEPTWDEMFAFGVGINLSQCFGLTIDTYSLVQHFGIGIYLRHTDECVISGNRITQNGHNIGLRGTITAGLGNTNKILNNALGANRRVGCIRQEQTVGTVVRNNYFETYSDACRFVWSSNSIGLIWSSNRVDNPNFPLFAGHTVTTPICFIDDWHSVSVRENFMGENGEPVPPMSFGYTYWTGVFNLSQYEVDGNSLHWPTPGTPHPLDGTDAPMTGGVRTGQANRYRFAADNIPNAQLAGAATFPFEINAGTGRWMTIKTAGVAELSVKFQLQNQFYRRYALRFVVQNANGGATGGVAGVSVNYIGAATTSIGTFALDPTSTTDVDIRQVAVTIPVGEVTNGIVEVKIATQLARWEEIILVPIDETNGIVEYYGPTASYDPISGSIVTAGSSTNQHNYPLYDLVDVNRPIGEEIGAIRISRLGTLAKKFFMGWADAIGAAGGAFLQAVQSGVAARPLALNPSGGPVLLRTSTDDGSHDIQATGNTKLTGALDITGQLTARGTVQFTALGANAIVSTDGASDLGTIAGISDSVTVVTGLIVSTTTIGYQGGASPATYVSAVGTTTKALGFTTGVLVSDV